METLKIAYADFWPEWEDENFIEPVLKKHYNVVIDQQNPDVLFHSIFGGMQETPKYKCKKILFLGENYRASKFFSDYSISFDPHTPTNFRLPLWQVYILMRPYYLNSLFDRLHHSTFERFASFTVSNGNNFMRNGIFQQLNSYKRVHSYGRYLTNSYELQNASKGKYWRDAKESVFKEYRHKFAITYENTPYPYYCTEKIMDGFLEGSVPIYWGDPKVKEDFNEKAFINVNDHGGDLLNFIKKMDLNKEIFEEKYNEPVFTNSQKDKLENNLKKFETWLIKSIK